MERSQTLTTRAPPSTLSTADRARELWRMKMASKSYVIIPTTPQTMQSKQRGFSASAVLKQNNQRNSSTSQNCNPIVYKQQRRQQETFQPRPLTKIELLKTQEEYYGGESLWHEDVLEEISMVSYRATRMTASVKKLFSEITTNARPLRRGETRDLIYLAKERYEKEMEADYCILSKTNTSSRIRASKSAPISGYSCPNECASRTNRSLDNNTARNSTADLERTSSRISSARSRIGNGSVIDSKQVSLRNRSDTFPRSRSSSRISQTNASHTDKSTDKDTNNTSIRPRPVSAGNPNREVKPSACNQPLSCNESQPQLELSFKKALLHARYRISQWIRRYKE